MTVVEPILKEVPGDAFETRVTAVPELSVAVGSVQLTTALLAPTAAVTSWLPGQLEMTGAVLSLPAEEINRREYLNLCPRS